MADGIDIAIGTVVTNKVLEREAERQAVVPPAPAAAAAEVPKKRGPKPKPLAPGEPPRRPHRKAAEPVPVPAAASGKPAEKTRVPRKPPAKIVDRRHAMRRHAEDFNQLAALENADHPDRKIALISLEASAPVLAASFSPDQCAQLGSAAFDMLGEAWGVKTRPAPAAIVAWGEAASEASKFLPQVEPVYVAIFGLVLSSLVCAAPMFKARAMKNAGLVEDPERCGGVAPSPDMPS